MRLLKMAVVAALLAGSAHATERMVIVKPGGEGSSRKAKTFLADWTTYLQRTGGTDIEVSDYYNDAGKGLAALREGAPAYAVVGFDFYCAHRREFGMRPLLATTPDGRPFERFVVLTRAAGPGRLDELRGRRLVGRHLSFAPFGTQLVLDGRLGPEVDIRYEERTLSAIRAVLEGKADGAVVSEKEWQQIQAVPKYAGDLRAIHTSGPVPSAVIVAFGAHSGEDLVRALEGMKDTVDGRALLETMGSAAFVPVDAEAIDRACRAFDAGEGRGERRER